MKSHFLLALLLLFLTGMPPLCADSKPSPQAVTLVDSMAERLCISRDVAWAKYRKHAPVNDPAREAAVLADLQSRGKRIGLADSSVRSLFEAQFLASKALQRELISGWNAGRPEPATPPQDLQKEIRPILDKISSRMLLAWKNILPQLPSRELRQYAEQRLHEQGFSREVAALASRPFD